MKQRVTNDNSIRQAFEVDLSEYKPERARQILRNLLKIVGTFSIKPTYAGDVGSAVDFVKGLLTRDAVQPAD